MAALTLMQRYYGINAALNTYLISKGISCPVYKYGIDPATLVDQSGPSPFQYYPYLQSYIRPATPQAWTSADFGTLTEFDYHLSFFTAPSDEYENDSSLFIPFDVAMNALSDVNLNLLVADDGFGNKISLADLLDLKYHYEFEMVSGAVVPAAFLIARMRAVCAYGIEVPGVGLSTNIDDAITWSEQ